MSLLGNIILDKFIVDTKFTSDEVDLIINRWKILSTSSIENNKVNHNVNLFNFKILFLGNIYGHNFDGKLHIYGLDYYANYNRDKLESMIHKYSTDLKINYDWLIYEDDHAATDIDKPKSVKKYICLINNVHLSITYYIKSVHVKILYLSGAGNNGSYSTAELEYMGFFNNLKQLLQMLNDCF